MGPGPERAGVPFAVRTAIVTRPPLPLLNSALMYAARLSALSLVPGMFLGFASSFATFFGGFGYHQNSPWAAWVSVVAMNALGPVYAYLTGKLTFARAEDEGAQVTDPAPVAAAAGQGR